MCGVTVGVDVGMGVEVVRGDGVCVCTDVCVGVDAEGCRCGRMVGWMGVACLIKI